jgi:hypothetical protein
MFNTISNAKPANPTYNKLKFAKELKNTPKPIIEINDKERNIKKSANIVRIRTLSKKTEMAPSPC